jgi:hypothetical protein
MVLKKLFSQLLKLLRIESEAKFWRTDEHLLRESQLEKMLNSPMFLTGALTPTTSISEQQAVKLLTTFLSNMGEK